MSARSLPLVALLAAHALCQTHPLKSSLTVAYKGPADALESPSVYYMHSGLDDDLYDCYKEYSLDVEDILEWPCGFGINVTVNDRKPVDVRIVYDRKSHRFQKVTVSRTPGFWGICVFRAPVRIETLCLHSAPPPHPKSSYDRELLNHNDLY